MFFKHSCQPSEIFGESPNARRHSSPNPHLETGFFAKCQAIFWWKCKNITKEHSIHFPLFNYSFKLSGRLDKLILPCIEFQPDLNSAKPCMPLNFFIFVTKKVRCFLSRIMILKSWQPCISKRLIHVNQIYQLLFYT